MYMGDNGFAVCKVWLHVLLCFHSAMEDRCDRLVSDILPYAPLSTYRFGTCPVHAEQGLLCHHRVRWALGTPVTATALKLLNICHMTFLEWLPGITTALLGLQAKAGFSHGGDARLHPFRTCTLL